jgi:8-oxo-dGTP diphosphatase
MNGPKISTSPSQEPKNRKKVEDYVSFFANADEITDDFISFLNTETNKKDLEKMVFSVVNVSDKFFVYVDANLQFVKCEITPENLTGVLKLVKQYNQEDENADTTDIRDILLVLGKGVLKSYDVYSKIVTTGLTKVEIKSLMRSENFWLDERKSFHEFVTKEYLAKVLALSEQIKSSEKTEVAIYCVRGSTASGKSSFIKSYVADNVNSTADTSGVISTDSIKNTLIEMTKNTAGLPLTGYPFHEEASMLSDLVLDEVILAKVPFFIDKRMQEEKDLPELLAKVKDTGLPVVIFDVKVDFLTSALRALSRTGAYPDSPAPNFNGFVKTYRQIEENRDLFVGQSLASGQVKQHWLVVNNIKPEIVPLKVNYVAVPDAHTSEVIRSDNFQDVVLSDGQTLKSIMDEKSEKVFESKYSRDYYLARISENVNLTSRSAKGEINTSASPDKKQKIKVDLSKDEVESRVKANTKIASEYVSANRNMVLTSPAVLKNFIEEVAFKVNDGIILDRKLLFREGENSEKYNYVYTENVRAYFDKFVEELYYRILDVNWDKVELAAWIEWNIDFCGHFFSDGCGRIAKLISAWALMRCDLDLPNYLLGQDGFDTVRESYRRRFSLRTKVEYVEPTNDKAYEDFLKYYRRLFIKTERKEQILGAGGLIYNAEKRFLVLQTSKGKDRGKWVIPGGKMEAGELPLDAFKREVKEETNLDVEMVVPLGNRDHTALSGNQYHFYDYQANTNNESDVRINDESLSFRWVTEDESRELSLTDSTRNFINRYFKEPLGTYYTKIEEIKSQDLDVPSFAEHTMYKNLGKYVEGKLPTKQLREFLLRVKRFEVHGIYPDLKLISEVGLGFTVKQVISESSVKLDNSNSVRPIFVLAEKDGEEIIVCCTTPGRDHLIHYASMIGYLLKDTGVTVQVFAYPDAENKIDKWTGLDETLIYENDIVVLGYSTHFKEMFLSNGYTQISTSQNSFYKSTRFKTKKGNVVNCLEANYGHWGDISGFLAEKICQLGAGEIIHIGKVGTLSHPDEVYERIYIPKSFIVARRDQVFFGDTSVDNSMEYISEHTSDTHASVATTMEETLSQRQSLEDVKVDTIDIESSKIAQSIALYNQRSGKKVKYGAIHFASDYLKKEDEVEGILEFDLASSRDEIKAKKSKILKDIWKIVHGHI